MTKRLSFLIVFVLAAFIVPCPLRAKENKPLIRLDPFLIEGVGGEEARLIESLILSYLSDFGDVMSYGASSFPDFSLAFDETGDLDSWTRIPDYIFSGSIYLERDNRIFTLQIHKTTTGQSVSFTSVHKTTGELVLKARSLVEAIFSAGGTDAAKIRETPPENINGNIVAGTWRGETGVEIIRLRPGGQGIAIFSSGAQMDLVYRIEDNTLKVMQNSPNTERYYHPLPFNIAKLLSAGAELMKWELFLYKKGSVLRGIKIMTGVSYEGDTLLQLLPGDIRNVEWTRMARQP
jgi:hypothetical protein